MLKTLRDFLDEKQLQFLPGDLLIENCILLTQKKRCECGCHKSEKYDHAMGNIACPCGGNPYKTVLQIFSHTGIWIGECTPDFIPEK